MVIVGGGGAGGANSGGGGGSGLIIYAKNLTIKSLNEKQIKCYIANSSTTDNNGNNTVVTIDGNEITAYGGKRGTRDGFTSTLYYGDGADLNNNVTQILSNYVSNPDTEIAMCSNGGGAGGSNAYGEGAGGGSGASMSSNGQNNSGITGGRPVQNTDGTGGYNGGYCNSFRGGVGRKLNNVIIPIQTIFQGGGQSGDSHDGTGTGGSGSGGGAALYGSGGKGGAALHGQATDGTDGGIWCWRWRRRRMEPRWRKRRTRSYFPLLPLLILLILKHERT